MLRNNSFVAEGRRKEGNKTGPECLHSTFTPFEFSPLQWNVQQAIATNTEAHYVQSELFIELDYKIASLYIQHARSRRQTETQTSISSGSGSGMWRRRKEEKVHPPSSWWKLVSEKLVYFKSFPSIEYFRRLCTIHRHRSNHAKENKYEFLASIISYTYYIESSILSSEIDRSSSRSSTKHSYSNWLIHFYSLVSDVVYSSPLPPLSFPEEEEEERVLHCSMYRVNWNIMQSMSRGLLYPFFQNYLWQSYLIVLSWLHLECVMCLLHPLNRTNSFS